MAQVNSVDSLPSIYVGSQQALPSLSPSNFSYGLSPLSTISPSEKTAELSQANKRLLNAHIVIINLTIQSDDLNRKELLLESTHIDENREKLKKQNEEKSKELTILAIKVDNATTWGALKNGSLYLTNAVSAITGLTACSNPVVGTALVAAGVTGLINRVVVDTGLMGKIGSYFTSSVEGQKSFSETMDTVLSWGSSIASVASCGFGAFSSAIPNASFDLLQKAGNFASSTLSAVTNFQSTMANSQVAKTDKVLIDMERDKYFCTSSISQTTSHVEELTANSQAIISKAGNVLSALNEAIKKLIQKRGK